MTRSQMYHSVKRTIEGMYKDTARINHSIDYVNKEFSTGNLTNKAQSERLLQLRMEKAGKIREAQQKVNQILADYKAEQAEPALDGKQLSSDAALFNLGVQLSEDQVLKIMQNCPNNYTMQTLCIQYAQQHDFSTAAKLQLEQAADVVMALAAEKEAASTLESTADIIFSRYAEANYHEYKTDDDGLPVVVYPEFYDRVMQSGPDSITAYMEGESAE